MKNIIFVFAVSFCAMFAANVALATAPKSDNSDIGSAHDVFTNLPLTGGESDGIAGVTYVNRAVNSAGAAATAAEAHAAAAGAYAVSAKASAEDAAEAAANAQTAANNANEALADKADKSEIPTVNDATLTIQRNGTEVGTFTANASAAKTINIVDNDTIYTLPKASNDTLGGVKVGANLSIDDNGVLSATDTTYSAGSNITISKDGEISATVPTGALASLNTVGSSEITDNAVKTAQIADGEVKTADIADSAVTTAKIADSAVTSAKIADSALTTAKIADSAVTAVKTTGIIGKVPSGSENSTDLASIWVQ